jgi:hypothetical protein
MRNKRIKLYFGENQLHFIDLAYFFARSPMSFLEPEGSISDKFIRFLTVIQPL